MIITTSSSTKRQQQQQEQQQQPTSSDQTTMETSPPPSLSSSSTSRYYFTPSSQQPSSMINTIVADLPSQQQTEIRENGNLDANTSRMILYGGMEEEDGCCCYDKEQYHEEDGGSHYYYGRVVVHRYYYRFMRRSGAAARYVNDCCRSYFRRLMRPSSSSSSSSQNNNNNNNILPNIISRFLLIGLCYALFYILLLLNDSSSPSSSSPQQQQQQQTLSTALLYPGGIIFNTFLLWISSLVLGYVVEIIFCGMQLRIVGMILAGLLLTNGLPPHVRDLVCLDNETSLTAGVIRGMGLTVILIRSGLEIDVNKLFRRSSSSNRSGGGSGGGGGGGSSTMGRMTLRLTILPGLIEATSVALVVHHASSLSTSSSFVPGFEMPYLWGYSLGFILAAVSPAIVVGGMLRLQKDGYGVEKGIPSMVVMAASFDDVVAISGFSVVMDLAIRSASSSSGGGGAFLTLESLIHGPLSVLLGVGVGCAGGIVLSATSVWNTRGKRSLAMMFLGLIIMFGTKEMHFSGSGALGVIVMAMTASSCWRRGGCVVFDDYVSCFTTTRRRRRRRQRRQRQLQQQHDHHNDEFNDEIEQQYSNNNSSNNNNKKKNSNNNLTSMVHDTERDFENIWNIACEPLLFGVIGNALDFTTISNETISKSLMVVTIGLCFRLVTAYLATAGGSSSSSSSSGGGGVVTNDNERTGGAEERADETTTTTTTTTKTAFFTHSERLFIALSWIPKATVQAALCSLPLDLIKEHLSDSENYELYLEWGHIILSTSIVSILVTAPLGVLFIQFLGPRLLTRDTKNDDDDDDDDDTAAVGVAVAAAADDGDEETAEESGQYDWSRREEEGDTSMELDTTMESVDSKMCDDV